MFESLSHFIYLDQIAIIPNNLDHSDPDNGNVPQQTLSSPIIKISKGSLKKNQFKSQLEHLGSSLQKLQMNGGSEMPIKKKTLKMLGSRNDAEFKSSNNVLSTLTITNSLKGGKSMRDLFKTKFEEKLKNMLKEANEDEANPLRQVKKKKTLELSLAEISKNEKMQKILQDNKRKSISPKKKVSEPKIVIRDETQQQISDDEDDYYSFNKSPNKQQSGFKEAPKQDSPSRKQSSYIEALKNKQMRRSLQNSFQEQQQSVFHQRKIVLSKIQASQSPPKSNSKQYQNEEQKSRQEAIFRHSTCSKAEKHENEMKLNQGNKDINQYFECSNGNGDLSINNSNTCKKKPKKSANFFNLRVSMKKTSSMNDLFDQNISQHAKKMYATSYYNSQVRMAQTKLSEVMKEQKAIVYKEEPADIVIPLICKNRSERTFSTFMSRDMSHTASSIAADLEPTLRIAINKIDQQMLKKQQKWQSIQKLQNKSSRNNLGSSMFKTTSCQKCDNRHAKSTQRYLFPIKAAIQDMKDELNKKQEEEELQLQSEQNKNKFTTIIKMVDFETMKHQYFKPQGHYLKNRQLLKDYFQRCDPKPQRLNINLAKLLSGPVKGSTAAINNGKRNSTSDMLMIENNNNFTRSQYSSMRNELTTL